MFPLDWKLTFPMKCIKSLCSRFVSWNDANKSPNSVKSQEPLRPVDDQHFGRLKRLDSSQRRSGGGETPQPWGHGECHGIPKCPIFSWG